MLEKWAARTVWKSLGWAWSITLAGRHGCWILKTYDLKQQLFSEPTHEKSHWLLCTYFILSLSTDHLPTTYRPHTDLLLTTYWPLTDHLLTLYQPLTDLLPTTYRPLTDHLLTTYRPLTNHLPTTYRPLTDHLLTTYRPLTDHLHPLPTTFLQCSLFMITQVVSSSLLLFLL